MTANEFAPIGQYLLKMYDDVLVHESIYRKFLNFNANIDENFNEIGYVKIRTTLYDLLGFYRVSNEENLVVSANQEEYADYNGNVASDNRAGYPIGGVADKWHLYKVRFDRARQFKYDNVDINISGHAGSIGHDMAQFFKLAVATEQDAVATSVIADCTTTSLGNRAIETLTTANIVGKLLDAEAYVYNKGGKDFAIVMTMATRNLLVRSSDFINYRSIDRITETDADGKSITFEVLKFNGHPIYILPNDRAMTDIALTNNGYVATASSRYINFLFVPVEEVYPVERISKLREYDESVVYTFDGIVVNFHFWYDFIIPVMKRVAFYASLDNNLIGANGNIDVAVASKAGETTGSTFIEAVYTEPKGVKYSKIYVSTSAFGAIGTTQAGGTLVEVGSPFTPADDDLYVALTDGAGKILLKSSAAIKFTLAEQVFQANFKNRVQKYALFLL